MPSRRPLKGGAPRLLGHHGGADGKAYRRAFDALASEFRLDSPLLRFEGGRVAALRVEFEAAMLALADARRKRRQGKGRRPNTKLVEQLARRAGLADNSYAQAFERLRGLVAACRNGHASVDDLLDQVGAAARQQAAEGERRRPVLRATLPAGATSAPDDEVEAGPDGD